MTETKYSEFTLNFNPRVAARQRTRTRRTRTAARLIGKAKVIDSDGTETEFEVAAWGPNTAQDRRAGLLQRHLEPQGPRLARAPAEHARSTARSATPSKASSCKKLGTLTAVRAHRSRDPGRQGQRQDPADASMAMGSFLLPSGPRYIDLSAWYRPEHGFYSGNAPLHDPAAARAARAAKPAAEPHLITRELTRLARAWRVLSPALTTLPPTPCSLRVTVGYSVKIP